MDPTRWLTPQERRVIELACYGLTYKEMAAALGISAHTIRDHLRAITDKLGVPSKTAAAALWRAAHPDPDPTIAACVRAGRPIPRIPRIPRSSMGGEENAQ